MFRIVFDHPMLILWFKTLLAFWIIQVEHGTLSQRFSHNFLDFLYFFMFLYLFSPSLTLTHEVLKYCKIPFSSNWIRIVAIKKPTQCSLSKQVLVLRHLPWKIHYPSITTLIFIQQRSVGKLCLWKSAITKIILSAL